MKLHTVLAACAAFALAAPASAAIYVKIPHVGGDVRASTAGSGHDEWIIIDSMSSPIYRAKAEDSKPRSFTGGVRVATGDVNGAPADNQRPVAATKKRYPAPATLAALFPSRNKFGEVTLKRGVIDCRKGLSYPALDLRDDTGKTARLTGVTITQCTTEEVSFYYNKIVF